MSILIGYVPGKGSRGALDLGTRLARSLRTSIEVATVVPKPWTTPSMARVDAEFNEWSTQTAADAERAARDYLDRSASDVKAGFHRLAHRSVSTALMNAADETGADMLVLGSSGDGRLGQVVVGSTADKLLHSSPITVAIAPRGYRTQGLATIDRITCSFAGHVEASRVVGSTAALATATRSPLRLASFAIRGGTMYPPEVGLRAEDDIASELKVALEEALDAAVEELLETGFPREQLTTEVVGGASWRDALDELHWQDGEVLAIGSSGPLGPMARVFLGSRATKIIRHSPVPVLLLPHR